MASKLGDFFVDIGAKPNTQGIKQFSGALGGLSKIAIGISAIVAGIGTAGIGIIAGTAKETAELNRQAKDLGVSVGSLDKFQKMFELAGGSGQQALSIIDTLNKKITMFQFGEYDEFLGKTLQLAPQDFTGNFLKDLDTIKSRLDLLFSPKEKKAILEGAGFGEALRLLRLSNDEYKALGQEAEKTGMLNKNMANDSERFAENLVKINQHWRQFKRELATTALPEFNKITQQMVDLFKNKEFQTNVSSFFENILTSLPVVIEGLSLMLKILVKTGNFFKKATELGEAGAGVAIGASMLDYDKAKFDRLSQETGFTGIKQFENFDNIQKTNDAISENRILNFSPVLNLEVKTDATAEDISKEVDKTLKVHFLEANNNFKRGKF